MKDGMTYHPDAMDGRMHTKCQAGHAMPGFMHDTRTTVGQLQRKLQVHPHSVARTTVVLLLIIESCNAQYNLSRLEEVANASKQETVPS